MEEGDHMQDTTISANDLRALLDVAEGFTTENGLDAVARYAIPEEVHQAINNATAAMHESDIKLQDTGTMPPKS